MLLVICFSSIAKKCIPAQQAHALGERRACAGSRPPRIVPDRRHDHVVVGLGGTANARERLLSDKRVLSARSHAAVVALKDVLPEAGRNFGNTPGVCHAASEGSCAASEAHGVREKTAGIVEVRVTKNEWHAASIEEYG